MDKSSSGLSKRKAASRKPSDEDTCLPLVIRERGYNMGDEIGAGNFSRVYKATSKKLGDRTIACKLIRLDKVSALWKDKCLRKELKIIRSLHHPYIVRVYDIIKTRTKVYIFMEYASNLSVAYQLDRNACPLDESDARMWFAQTLSAIVYMHTMGIAHRDIKNENILLDADWNVKLSDFGFSCYMDKPSWTSCGTIGYIAPEVLNPPYDPSRADIWSLGVCLFEMLTCIKPFAEKDYTTPIIVPEHIKLSPSCISCLGAMLHLDPSTRITSKDLLHHPFLTDFIEKEP